MNPLYIVTNNEPSVYNFIQHTISFYKVNYGETLILFSFIYVELNVNCTKDFYNKGRRFFKAKLMENVFVCFKCFD